MLRNKVQGGCIEREPILYCSHLNSPHNNTTSHISAWPHPLSHSHDIAGEVQSPEPDYEGRCHDGPPQQVEICSVHPRRAVSIALEPGLGRPLGGRGRGRVEWGDRGGEICWCFTVSWCRNIRFHCTWIGTGIYYVWNGIGLW